MGARVHAPQSLPEGMQTHFKRIQLTKANRAKGVFGLTAIPAMGVGYLSTAGTPSLARSAVATGVGAIAGGVVGVKFYQPNVDIAHIEAEAALGKPEHKGFIGRLQKPYLIHTRRGFEETDYVPVRGGHMRMLARPDLAKDPAMLERYRAQRGRANARVGSDQRMGDAVSNSMDRASARIDNAVLQTVGAVAKSKWLNKLAGAGYGRRLREDIEVVSPSVKAVAKNK